MLVQIEILERCRICNHTLSISYLSRNGDSSYAIECFECGFSKEITKAEYETFKKFPKIHGN
jgi:transcription elongation factor Elf1